MTEHEELIHRLSDAPPPADDDSGMVIPVRVRRSVEESLYRGAQAFEDAAPITDAGDELVAEYEQRYYGTRTAGVPVPMGNISQQGAQPREKRWRFKLPPQYRRTGRVLPEAETDEEKWWAAAAHATALVTIVFGIITGGLGALLTVFLPLAIFAAYRNKSEYIARHALQAFAAQVVGFGGFIAFNAVFASVWGILLIISGLLILLLVGVILFPLVFISGILVMFASLALPFGTLIYSMIATIEALNGHSYSYPWIGDWVDDQLYGYLDE